MFLAYSPKGPLNSISELFVLHNLGWVNWSDEDFIGRICRVVRRLNAGPLVVQRTMSRALMKYQRYFERLWGPWLSQLKKTGLKPVWISHAMACGWKWARDDWDKLGYHIISLNICIWYIYILYMASSVFWSNEQLLWNELKSMTRAQMKQGNNLCINGCSRIYIYWGRWAYIYIFIYLHTYIIYTYAHIEGWSTIHTLSHANMSEFPFWDKWLYPTHIYIYDTYIYIY